MLAWFSNEWGHMQINRLRRREIIGILGGAAMWPLVARAQQPALPVIGFLNGTSPEGYGRFVSAFRQGLSETGYVENINVAIEYRWAEGQYDRLPALAADLVRRQVSLIAATSTPANLIAKAATTTIPIVFTTSSDPVALGLVASLDRPGGNITGVATLNVDVGPKRLEVLHQMIPTDTIITLLVNPTNPNVEAQTRNVREAARIIGREIAVTNATSEGDIDAVFAALGQQRTRALFLNTDAFFFSRRDQLIALARRYAVPAIFDRREFAEAGGLISYGGSVTDAYRLAGIYSGRILKGEKPADLPVIQSTKIELIINLKTAKALGVTLPPALLGRADEVME